MRQKFCHLVHCFSSVNPFPFYCLAYLSFCFFLCLRLLKHPVSISVLLFLVVSVFVSINSSMSFSHSLSLSICFRVFLSLSFQSFLPRLFNTFQKLNRLSPLSCLVLPLSHCLSLWLQPKKTDCGLARNIYVCERS